MDRRDEPALNGSETFMVLARRCRRCGGLLTSAQAIANGYGHVCLRKERGAEAARPLPGQVVFPGMETEEEDEDE